MRAGDADREVVAEILRTALGEGRLDLHEVDERPTRTYAARTYAELEPIVADLPGDLHDPRGALRRMTPSWCGCPGSSASLPPSVTALPGCDESDGRRRSRFATGGAEVLTRPARPTTPGPDER